MMIENVQIGNLTYHVSEAADIRRKEDDAYLFGYVCNEDQTIEVREALQPTLKKVALMHEIIHAVFFQTGHFFDETDEERICVALSHSIVQLLQSNPALVQYLVLGAETK